MKEKPAQIPKNLEECPQQIFSAKYGHILNHFNGADSVLCVQACFDDRKEGTYPALAARAIEEAIQSVTAKNRIKPRLIKPSRKRQSLDAWFYAIIYRRIYMKRPRKEIPKRIPHKKPFFDPLAHHAKLPPITREMVECTKWWRHFATNPYPEKYTLAGEAVMLQEAWQNQEFQRQTIYWFGRYLFPENIEDFLKLAKEIRGKARAFETNPVSWVISGKLPSQKGTILGDCFLTTDPYRTQEVQAAASRLQDPSQHKAALSFHTPKIRKNLRRSGTVTTEAQTPEENIIHSVACFLYIQKSGTENPTRKGFTDALSHYKETRTDGYGEAKHIVEKCRFLERIEETILWLKELPQNTIPRTEDLLDIPKTGENPLPLDCYGNEHIRNLLKKGVPKNAEEKRILEVSKKTKYLFRTESGPIEWALSPQKIPWAEISSKAKAAKAAESTRKKRPRSKQN